MWAAVSRAGLGLVVLSFLMWVVRTVLDPLVSLATAGAHADHATVVRIESYFAALTLENLTLVAALGVGIYLFGRASVERQLG